MGSTLASAGSEIPSNQIPHIISNITVDGELNELVWKQALKIELSYEVNPAENIPAAVNTTAYVFEDGKNLYVAFNALDPNPDKIRAYLSERDNLWKSDYVGVALDTFDDSRRAFQFYTNAIGVQADSIIDGVTENDDLGWDAIWKSAGSLQDNGYSVEMMIPLESLRFENNQQVKQWSMKFSRFWIRDVKHEFSNVKNDRNNDCALCQFDTFTGFEKTTPARNLTLIPAITILQSDTRDVESQQGWESGDLNDRESLDLRWGINQNIFLNATINPDFSQVEADAIQLEVNKRFAIFVPEKRAFFLDGADYFSNWSRLVHTKLFTEPEYGVKLTGKSGDHSYGIISLKDKHTIFLLPDSQNSQLISLLGKESDNQLFRYRYDLGEQGNLGFTYTQREADEYHNNMFSLDGKYWLGESDYFKFQAMTADTRNPVEIQQNDELSGNAFSVNYTHVSRDWALFIDHHHFGKDFRADSGFVSKSNWKSTKVDAERRWYPKDQQQWWKRISLESQWQQIADLDGNQLNNTKKIAVIVQGIYQSEITFLYSTDQQNYIEQRLASNLPSLLFQDQYQVNNYQLFAEITPFADLDLAASIKLGDEIDFSTGILGDLISITSSAEYQLNDNWRFTLEYINQQLKNSGNTIFDVHLYNFRAAYQISVNSFLRYTIQADREGDDRSFASQLLYSYQVDPFTLFFLGYSDQGFQTAQLKHLERTDRTLFMKFSYAWQL